MKRIKVLYDYVDELLAYDHYLGADEIADRIETELFYGSIDWLGFTI